MAGNDRFTTWAEVINEAVEKGLRDLWTCIPAKVVKWDGKGRADCQILVKNVTESEEGEREVASFPVVPGCGVQFFGAGPLRMTVPISDGSGGKASTIGTLFFSFRSLDKWLSGSGDEVDPELDHDHALTDAIFVPGLTPFGASNISVPSDAIVVAETPDNAQFVALSQKTADRIKTLEDAFAAHTHLFTGTGTVNGVNPTFTPTYPSVAATKFKAE